MSSKSSSEEEYFAQIENEKKAALREKREADADAQALLERRALHQNHCGRCGAVMKTEIFRGVEIDVCPECGSVLLDPGELEELTGADQSGVIGTLTDLFSFSRQRKEKK
jgi:Zn-finger nucleic acid-binding protein